MCIDNKADINLKSVGKRCILGMLCEPNFDKGWLIA